MVRQQRNGMNTKAITAVEDMYSPVYSGSQTPT